MLAEAILPLHFLVNLRIFLLFDFLAAVSGFCLVPLLTALEDASLRSHDVL